MGCCFRGKRESKLFWWALICATCFFCSLLIFYSIIYKDFTCFSQTSCLTTEEPRTENLHAEKCINVCNTKECIRISNRILSYMDPSSEPCNDFYQFVCGKYREKYDGAGNHTTMGDMVDDFYPSLKVMIDASRWPEGSAMDKVKVVFDSCMNPASSDVRALQDLLDFLHSNGIPEWPRLSGNFTFASIPWYEIVSKLTLYEDYVFFKFHEAGDDSEFPSGRLQNLTFSPAKIVDEVSEKLASDVGQNALTTVLLHLGLDTESSQEITKTFISIEKERQKLIRDASKSYCREEPIVMNCMEENSPSMNIMCDIMASILSNEIIEKLYDKNRLEMSCEDYHYANGLQDIIKKYPDRDIANYIALTVFSHNLKDLDFSLKMKLRSLLQSDYYDDFSASLDKQKRCIHWLTQNMQYPLGVMYIDKIFQNAVAEQVDDIMKKFINATTELFLRQSWLENSKYILADGISSLKNSLEVTIETMRNITEINGMFEMFEPTRSSFIRNTLLNKRNRFIQILSAPYRMILFLRHDIFDVNAFSGSSIRVGFGILTPPFFHPGNTNLFNYAGIGHIIGHEIGHFFFFEFNPQSISEINRIQDSFKCLIGQYSTFKLRKIGKNMQGNTTLIEDVPDQLGVKTMEMVSEEYIGNAISEDMILPGLSYSPRQLSYIAMGQTWCAAYDAKKENHFYTENPHSPPEYRVIGTLQNSHRFSEVFHCSKTSYMNPVKKCIMFQ